MRVEVMSSEESEDDLIKVKPLPWRSTRVKDFFQSLDEHQYNDKSAQAKRQMKRRVLGEVSTRPKPAAELGIPSWVFTKN